MIQSLYNNYDKLISNHYGKTEIHPPLLNPYKQNLGATSYFKQNK